MCRVCHKNLIPVIWRTTLHQSDIDDCQRLLEEQKVQQTVGEDESSWTPAKKRKHSEGTGGQCIHVFRMTVHISVGFKNCSSCEL